MVLFGVAFRGYVSCNLLGGSSNLGLGVWCLVLCCLVAVFLWLLRWLGIDL